VHSTYTLAMQSSTPEALTIAHRSNMKINRIDELASLCRRRGVVPRGELIWGLPGESITEFYRSYDNLARHTDALSVYPLYILPNTEYHERRSELGIVTRRVEQDTDYAYCVAHDQMTEADFIEGLRFIVANNILRVGSTFARVFPRVASDLGGVPFHQSIGRLVSWIDTDDSPMAERFRPYFEDPLNLHRQSLTAVWLAILRERDRLLGFFVDYVEGAVCAGLDAGVTADVMDAARYDATTFPVVRRDAAHDDGTYTSWAEFTHDWRAYGRGAGGADEPRPTRFRVRHRAGLAEYPISNWYFGLAAFQADLEAESHGVPAVVR